MFSKFSTQSVKLGQFNLTVVGNSELLNQPCISVAGSRKIDSSSSMWLEDIISQVRGHSVVSGLALGADAVAHNSAIVNGLPTIAVLPSGIDNIAPRSHLGLAMKILETGGALVSQFPDNAKPNRNSFISRNEVIAMLGKMLLMPQCDKHSGTMHTCRFTSKHNKTIVVQDANYSGNRYLINDSAFHTISK